MGAPCFLAHWWPQLGLYWITGHLVCLWSELLNIFFSYTLRKSRQNCSNSLCFIFLGQEWSILKFKNMVYFELFLKVIWRFLTSWIIQQDMNDKRAEPHVNSLPRSVTLRVSNFSATQLIREIIPLSNSICIWLFRLWNTFPFFVYLLIAFFWRDSSIYSAGCSWPCWKAGLASSPGSKTASSLAFLVQWGS